MKNYISTAKKLLLLCFLLIISESNGQCPVSNFTITSPTCSGSPLQISNYSTGSISYKWDFSPGFFSQPAAKMTDTLLNLSYPGDLTLATENDTNIAFVSGLGGGHMHRIIYGNGPQNPATLVEDLGNFGVLYQPSDMALYKENNTWYGFITDYGSNYLYRIRFGNSLRNTPDSITTVLTAAVSGFNNPWSIKIISDSTGAIYGMVSNHGSGLLSILSFGNSILNTIDAYSPIAIGASYIDDAVFAKSCGNWYAFIAGSTSGRIYRAEFGNSLDNSPVITDVINTSGGSPSDIVLVNDSSHWKLLYTDHNNYRVGKYDLGSDLSNITPVFLGSDYFNGADPKGICSYRKDFTEFVFVLYSTHNVQTFAYTNTVDVNKAVSTDMQPNDIVFNSPGIYPVTLVVTDSFGNSSSYTDTVEITPAPITNFTTLNTCFGDSTAFLDSSVLNTGSIVSWNWDFGDGGTSTTRNNTHKYLATGSYNVRLIAASSFGCSDTIIKTVDITPRPVAAFSSPPATCSQTSMLFTDLSTLGSGLITEWMWRFGNGDSSTTQHPSYSYPIGGNFNVKLSVTSDAGCSDSATTALTINDRPTADFVASNTCIGQFVLFADHSTVNNSAITGYQWDFGDATTDIAANPLHMYANTIATYQAQMIVTAANGCSDTTTQTIKINNIPTVNFSVTPLVACQNNDIFLTDLSSVLGDTISGWFWDFGDSTSSSIQNPVHHFSTPGLHTISLIAYSPSSCPGTVFQQNINVTESPVASFTYSTTCIGDNTHFTNTSVPASGSSIDSILWSFNGIDSSIISSPDYTFASPGNFPVVLTVLSPEGCMGTDTVIVPVHERPIADFSNAIACTGNAIQFTNVSSSDTLSSISQFSWNFGDFGSGVNNTSILADPTHTYVSSLNYTVSLIATTNFGCKDTVIKTIFVNPSPSAQFTYSPTCYGDLMEFFNPGSPSDSTYLWNFGDNQTNQLREPAHFYATPGSYTVRLNVTSSAGCVAIASKQVSVSPIPVANFNVTPACVNTNYQFQNTSSISSGNIDSYQWNITGLPKPDSIANPTYLFVDSGAYNVTLTTISDIGCSKSISKTLNVYGLPVANFSFDPQFGNPPLDVQTFDYSTGGQYYLWDFGDGVDVNLQEPSHIFTDSGLYVITQYVSSLFGCKDTMSKTIYVINPILDIAVTGDSSYMDGNYFHIVGRLENHGTREVTSLQMEARLENGNTIREELTETIPTGPLGFKTYAFHASFLINPGSDVKYYCITAMNPNGYADTYPGNNERCFNMTDEIIAMEPFPNPFTNQISFRLLLPQQSEIIVELIDMSGKIVKNIFEGRANKNLFEINTDLSDLPDGMYTARVIYNDKVTVRNIVKNSSRE